MNKNLILTAVGALIVGGVAGYGFGMYQNQSVEKFDTQSYMKSATKQVESTTKQVENNKLLNGTSEIDKLQATRLQEQEKQAQAEFQESEANEARRLASDKRLSDASRQPFGDGKVADQKSALSACSSIADIPEDECIALISLYWSTNGPKWTTGTNWLQNNSACTWHGVSCDNGHVIYLYLGDNQLSGPIPTEIGNLSKLEILSLYDNQLSGPIPTEIGNLSNLEGLYLYSNQLSGPIPTEIGNLSELRNLTIADTQLSGPIPAEIGNLSELEYLYFWGNQLSGPIPAEIGNLSKLTNLTIADTHLSGPIPAEIGNLSKLTNLTIANTQLSGPIPAEIGNLSKLESLQLPNNQLSGPIPAEIGNLSELTTLSLYANQLSGPIPAEIGNLSKLRDLWLIWNQFCGYIPDSFATAWLTTPDIDIRDNKLMKDGYSPMMTNWLAANVYFGAQNSTECPVIKPYCGDGICQSNERDKYGNPICKADCEGPVTPDTPKNGGGNNGGNRY